MPENILPVEPAAPTPAPIDPGQEPEQAETPEPAPGEETPTPPESTEKKEPEPSEAEKRIKKLVAQRNEKEREAAYWRGLAEGRVKMEPPPPAQETPPILEQFESYDDYLVSKAKYEFNQEQKQLTARRQQENVQRANLEALKTHQERLQKAAEIDPEILDIANDASLPVSPLMAMTIMQSETGPEVLRYLHEHRTEAGKIATMSPILAMREMVKIESKMAEQPPPPVKKISQAPEPIKTVGSKGASSIDEEKLSTDEWIRRRNEAKFKRR